MGIPDCRQYSLARTTTKTPRNVDTADRLVQACLCIICLPPTRLLVLENPDSGYLKTRPCVQGLPYVRVDYCMYQHPPLYRKRTRVWTNCTDWSPKLCDRSHLVDGKHPASAQRGYRKDDRRSGERTFTRDELHRLPRALYNEIFQVCQVALLPIKEIPAT